MKNETKQNYIAPQLEEIGGISDLTLSGGATTSDGNASQSAN